MDQAGIPVLQPITQSPDLVTAHRIQRFFALDTRKWESLSPQEQQELRDLEDRMEAAQLMAFRESVEAGDSEASRKAYFGSDFKRLAERFALEREHAEADERALDRRCVREARNDEPPAWMDER